MAFTIENITSVQLLSDLTLSPDGSKLVYRVTPSLKTGLHQTASLWYSPDTSEADSARQLTSGLYNDGSPAWHPNSTDLYFLSDRHSPGASSQLYKYSLDRPGEPSLLNDAFKDKKCRVEQFRISPDGHYVAFLSADEPTLEEENKAAQKDDARIWGERKGHARLRLYTASTGNLRTLVEDNRHVVSCTWRPDSKELLYLLSDRPDLEAQYQIATLYVVSILPPSSTPQTKFLINLPRVPSSDVIWPSPSHPDLYMTQSYQPHNIVDALAVHRFSPVKADPPSSPCHLDSSCFYLGENEDALSLVDLQSKGGEFAVGVSSGMDTRVDILNGAGKVFTLFGTNRCAGFRVFDVKKVGHEYVMACVLSSGPKKAPPNIWIGRVYGSQNLMLTTKLSSHSPWVANHKLGSIEVFEWKGEDGVPLQGMAFFPQVTDPSGIKEPLPTILDIHGGPYGRDTPDLSPFFLAWQPMLAERGFLVLSPNYRGSSGRGHAFARAAYHGVGTIDWSDVNGMVNEAVRRGLADKDKLAIGGWSEGGYLTAWGVSQTKNKFQCGVVGAGVTDWGSETTESDLPDFEADLGGAAPWIGSAAKLTGDPIRHVKDVETAVLVLHGESDVRVPVGQGIGFHRGLKRMSKYPDRHTLVVYPREGHIFSERKHAEDMMKRVIEHYEAWLK
ncbi:Alpha/Beta hydrolase protein [Gautieria morchelliformis]|nr:Alpha/Beta hydrolase protein [Gautieria morchelliformis]